MSLCECVVNFAVVRQYNPKALDLTSVCMVYLCAWHFVGTVIVEPPMTLIKLPINRKVVNMEEVNK